MVIHNVIIYRWLFINHKCVMSCKPSKQVYSNNLEHKFTTQQLDGYYFYTIIFITDSSDICNQCALTHSTRYKSKSSIIMMIDNVILNIGGLMSNKIVLRLRKLSEQARLNNHKFIT